jgi:putative Mn2+ efflux pump MntP
MDIRFKKYINTAFILGPMTFIMAIIGVTRNYGLHEAWLIKVITTWLTMFPIAFICGLVIIPIANRMTNKIKFVQPAEVNETVVKI